MYECCFSHVYSICVNAVLPTVQARPDVAVPGLRQLPVGHTHRFQSHAWHVEVNRSTGEATTCAIIPKDALHGPKRFRYLPMTGTDHAFLGSSIHLLPCNAQSSWGNLVQQRQAAPPRITCSEVGPAQCSDGVFKYALSSQVRCQACGAIGVRAGSAATGRPATACWAWSSTARTGSATTTPSGTATPGSAPSPSGSSGCAGKEKESTKFFSQPSWRNCKILMSRLEEIKS